MKYGRVAAILTIYSAFYNGVAASAQDRTLQRTSWFSTPFEVSRGSETVPAPGGTTTTEEVTLVTPPRIFIEGGTARTHWGLGYQLEFQIRFQGDLFNSWNHAADATISHGH